MATWELTESERQIIGTLRTLSKTYDNFQLKVYGQGSRTRRILDYEWSVRTRLESTKLKASVDD